MRKLVGLVSRTSRGGMWANLEGRVHHQSDLHQEGHDLSLAHPRKVRRDHRDVNVAPGIGHPAGVRPRPDPAPAVPPLRGAPDRRVHATAAFPILNGNPVAHRFIAC